MRLLTTLCLLACLGLCAGADATLATLNYAGGAGKNVPLVVTTNATEAAVVFTVSQGDNAQVQYTDTVAWTWLAVSGSSTAALPVAASQTLTLQLDGGAGTVTHFVKSASTGSMTITRVR